MGGTSEIANTRAALSARFVTTHWSVVLSAADSDSSRAAEALEKICRAYWYPLYAHVRRRGKSPADAQDLTQEFFEQLLTHDWLARADQARGRFRTFLLTALERFLANDWDKARALKRGGNYHFVPFDWNAAEDRYGAEPADPRSPEQAFERSWALALLGEVVQRLEKEHLDQGKAEVFTALKTCLVDPGAVPYKDIAQSLHMNENAVKAAVHRLRQRYRELLRAEIANTVASPDEVDAEMRHLFNVLAERRS